MVLSLIHLLHLLFLLTCPPPCTSLPQAPSRHAGLRLVLPDEPFAVVWNMPTAHCSTHYDIHLNLEAFGIVQNRGQNFQGQEMTIFYRDHLGKYPYLSLDGKKINGGIPQRGNLASHLAHAEVQVSALLQPGFNGLAVIDWEEWRPLWEHNFGSKMEYRMLSEQLVRRERPDLSDQEVTDVAQTEFEEAARGFMSETLHLGVKSRPGGVWGFYGFPFCFNERSDPADCHYRGRCHLRARQQNDRLSWLWLQSSGLYPSIYLPEELAGSKEAALMVRYRLQEALRVASLWPFANNTRQPTPVLPYTRLAFTHTLRFLNKTDLDHTLGESAALGAAGVVLWGESKFARSKHQCVLLRDYLQSALGPYIQTLQADARRCSLHRCHGNGRCARRRPASGHMISSACRTTSDSDEVDLRPDCPRERRPFREHFVCQCYPGWAGPQCQEQTGKSSDSY